MRDLEQLKKEAKANMQGGLVPAILAHAYIARAYKLGQKESAKVWKARMKSRTKEARELIALTRQEAIEEVRKIVEEEDPRGKDAVNPTTGGRLLEIDYETYEERE